MNLKKIPSTVAHDPYVIPAQAGIQATLCWTPACAGVTIIFKRAKPATGNRQTCILCTLRF
jgi:hypothetical protein